MRRVDLVAVIVACSQLQEARRVVCFAMRLLWVKVDTRTADWDLMGAIGHELRHTLEVLGDRKVTNNASMYMFYSSLAYTSFATKGDRGRFETRAAIETGDAVRNEVRDYRSSVSAVR